MSIPWRSKIYKLFAGVTTNKDESYLSNSIKTAPFSLIGNDSDIDSSPSGTVKKRIRLHPNEATATRFPLGDILSTVISFGNAFMIGYFLSGLS